jgi:hypothetical protein
MKIKKFKNPSHFWLHAKNPIEKSGDFPAFFLIPHFEILVTRKTIEKHFLAILNIV